MLKVNEVIRAMEKRILNKVSFYVAPSRSLGLLVRMGPANQRS
jgi:hypothetical protein